MKSNRTGRYYCRVAQRSHLCFYPAPPLQLHLL